MKAKPKKMIFLLADGLSFEALELLNKAPLSQLENTDLNEFYPEALLFQNVNSMFNLHKTIDPASRHLESLTSILPMVKMATGLPSKIFLDQLNTSHFCEGNFLLSRLKKNGAKILLATNSIVTDSTITGLLFPHLLREYEEKLETTFGRNKRLEHLAAENLAKGPWDLLAGGGRRAFFGKDTVDAITGEPGDRFDGVNILKRIMSQNELRVFTEDSYDEFRNSQLPDRSLLLLHHNYFRYIAERKRTNAAEPRFSDYAMCLLNHINDDKSKSWFAFIESGRIDHACHLNNGYLLLGELLELGRTIYQIIQFAKKNDVTVILTSDHATGGLYLPETFHIPQNPLESGIFWGDGPGITRPDDSRFISNKKLQTINNFTPETKFHYLKNQLSAQNRTVASHSRTAVPFFVSGNETTRFLAVNHFEDLFYSINDFFMDNTASKVSSKKKPRLYVITGPPGAGKSSVANWLSAEIEGQIVRGDSYFAPFTELENPWQRQYLDPVIIDMINDGIKLVKNGVDAILDFVFIDQIELDVLYSHTNLHQIEPIFILLFPDPKICFMRDSQRPIEERMGQRSMELSANFIANKPYFERFFSIAPDCSKTLDNIYSEIKTSIRKKLNE